MVTTAKPRTRRRREVPRRLLVASAFLLLLAAAALVLFQQSESGGSIAAQPAATLYISTGALPQHLTRLDRSTLDDLHGGGINLDTAGDWTLSADGSTLAKIGILPYGCPHAATEGQMILVRDVQSGAVRSCFHAAGGAGFPQLSRDGSRLVVLTRPMGAPEWQVFDAAHGRLLVTVKANQQDGLTPPLIDAKAQRLYWLSAPGPSGAQGPGPIQIFAYDLTTGAETGRLMLPDALAGVWQTGTEQGGYPLMAQLIPGVALSPDGRQLAIVRADKDAVTLIDTAHLTVERQLTLTTPTSLLDRLRRLLPFAPSTAEAKGMDGRALDAAYAPDGQRLYIFGEAGSVDSSGRPTFNGLGLRLLDLRTGSVVAQALNGEFFGLVLPAPDGRSLYVTGSASEGGSEFAPGPSYLLARLDASSLAVKATRSFPSSRTVLLMPSKHD